MSLTISTSPTHAHSPTQAMKPTSRSSTACRVDRYRPRLSRMNEPDMPGSTSAHTAIAATGAIIQGLGSRAAAGREVTASPASTPIPNRSSSGVRHAPPQSRTSTSAREAVGPGEQTATGGGELVPCIDQLVIDPGDQGDGPPLTPGPVSTMPISSPRDRLPTGFR